MSSRTADLHLHTFHSDGLRSPREVVDLAREQQLEIIAISDHDQLEGYFEIRDYARDNGVTLVPAVELSVEYRHVDVHILAYSFLAEDSELTTRLVALREARLRRGERMVQQLADHGYAITIEQVEKLTDGGAMGRPHVARALVESGVCSSIQDAFSRFLKPGGIGYIDKQRFRPEEVVALVRGAGGVTSIAHPSLYPDHRRLVPELLDFGIDGIEVLHPEVGNDDRWHYEKIASQRGLLMTGGSDDHGFENRRTIGSIRVPEQRIRPILDRLR